MKKLLLIVMMGFLLASCQSPKNVTKVNSSVKGMVYNNVTSKYTPMLTIANISEFSGNDDVLSYSVESYKYSNGSFETIRYAILRDSANEHKNLLEKFLEWNQTSSQRGDQFTKEIGRAKTYNGYSVYTFHSGNQYNNYLTVCFSMTDTPGCLIDGVTFDVNNVKLIINDINKFQSGDFKQLDTSIYN